MRKGHEDAAVLEDATGFAPAAVPLAAILILIVLSVVNFLWFHALAELFSVIVGVSLFLFARHSYVFTGNSFLLFLAQGFFWAAAIDLVHTLSYSGMGLIAGGDPNPATQLWLCARYLQAGTLLIAPYFLSGAALPKWTFWAFAAVAAASVATVFGGGFPHAFVEGQGLTPFKVGSEYAIIATLLLAGWRLHRRREALDDDLYRVVLGIIAATIVGEFAFTLYVSVYGLSNLVGHIAKFLAYWMLLQVVIQRMLAKPFRLLSRDARSFDAMPVPVLLLGRDRTIRACNEAARQQRTDGGLGRRLHEAWHSPAVAEADCPVCSALEAGDASACEIRNPVDDSWASVRIQPIGQDDAIRGFVCVHTDITERKRAEEHLRQAATVFESADEAVVVTDAQLRIRMVNRAFTELTGYAEEDVQGREPDLLRGSRHHRLFYGRMWVRIRAHGQWRGEIWYRRKDGEQSPALLSITAVTDEGGAVTHYVGVFADIARLKASEAKLDYLAHHDALTGLPNRLLLMNRLNQALLAVLRGGGRLAFMTLDLDRFKDINDSFGHATGDDLLRQVAQRLNDNLGGRGLVARLGSDEFAVLVENVGSPDSALQLARHAVDMIGVPWRLSNGVEVRVGASAGVSLAPDYARTAGELLQQADAAMYHAKAKRAEGCAVYSEELIRMARSRLELEARLRRAVSGKHLELHFQPQVSIGDGRVVGAEALVRWRDADSGELIPPNDFIPIAERSGLINDIGGWVITEACRQGVAWQRQGLEPLTLAVNVSPYQLRHGDLVATVEAALKDTGYPAQYLELELTETALMEDQEHAASVLQQLRALGLRIAIDDFGTGYSSLAYLKRFPLDILKIDKRFIEDLSRDPDDEAITATIIAMGHALGLKVLAEGVERAEQLEFLRRHGCDLFQGYLNSRPLPVEEFSRFVLAA